MDTKSAFLPTQLGDWLRTRLVVVAPAVYAWCLSIQVTRLTVYRADQQTHRRLRAFRALAWAVSPLSCGFVQQGVGPGGSAGAEPVVMCCPAIGLQVGRTKEMVNLRTTMGDNHVCVCGMNTPHSVGYLYNPWPERTVLKPHCPE